jgi:ABC-2 type transport system permease protein
MTFIIPILLMFIWGLVFGNMGSGSERLHLAFLNCSEAAVAKKIEKVLDSTKTFILIKSFEDENGHYIKFDTSSVQDYVKKGRVSAALVIPVDAYTDTTVGLKLKFYYDPKNDMEMQIIQGVLQQTIMTEVPDIFLRGMQKQAIKYLGPDSGKAFNKEIASTVGKYFRFDPKWMDANTYPLDDSLATESKEGQKEYFQNILQLERIQLVGQDIANPWATRGVGGWAMMFLLFALTGSATSLFDEKKSGVVLRILSAPISRADILWSKYAFNVSLGLIQLLILFLAGSILYKIDILSNFFNLILVLLASAIACTAFGMFLASISKTTAQASGFGTFLILAMSSIGGAWFPVSFMPDFIQTISKGTIVFWSMDGIQQVLWRGVSTMEILPNLGVLCGVAFVVSLISLWQFKKGHVF